MWNLSNEEWTEEMEELLWVPDSSYTRCSNCGRNDGNEAAGEFINPRGDTGACRGCTGACLHWAYHAVDRLLSRGGLERTLQRHERIVYFKFLSIGRILTNVNFLGFAYWQQLLVQEPHDGRTFSEEQLLDAIEYLEATTNGRVREHLVQVFQRCLDFVRQFKARPKLLSAISVAAYVDSTSIWQNPVTVSLAAFSGKCIYEGTCFAGERLMVAISTALPSLALPYRVASDLNLYSRTEFELEFKDLAWDKAPLLLPSECSFSLAAKGDTFCFSLLGGDKRRIKFSDVDLKSPEKLHYLMRLRCEDLLEICEPDADADTTTDAAFLQVKEQGYVCEDSVGVLA